MLPMFLGSVVGVVLSVFAIVLLVGDGVKDFNDPNDREAGDDSERY